MTQKLYGYRLTAQADEIGDWSFYNQDKLIGCALKRQNGSLYCFTGESKDFDNWAADRGLQAETCVFVFNPDDMTFTQE